jgi:hypothetical protein
MMKFYVIDTPRIDSPDDLRGGMRAIKEEGFSTREETPRCPACNRFLTGLEWLPPYRVELESWGKEFGDFARIAQEMIVSERFVRTFQDSGLKGLSPFAPVEVVKVTRHGRKPKQPLPRYFMSTVTLSPTTVDQQASGFVWADASKVCPVCLHGGRVKRYARTIIKEDTWNGDDIFISRGGPGPLVSERFKRFCERHAFLNVVFQPADQHSYDFFPWETQQGGITNGNEK